MRCLGGPGGLSTLPLLLAYIGVIDELGCVKKREKLECFSFSLIYRGGA